MNGCASSDALRVNCLRESASAATRQQQNPSVSAIPLGTRQQPRHGEQQTAHQAASVAAHAACDEQQGKAGNTAEKMRRLDQGQRKCRASASVASLVAA